MKREKIGGVECTYYFFCEKDNYIFQGNKETKVSGRNGNEV